MYGNQGEIFENLGNVPTHCALFGGLSRYGQAWAGLSSSGPEELV